MYCIKYSIFALQETRWNDNLIEGYKQLLNALIIYNNGGTSSKGVAFSISNYYKNKIERMSSFNCRILHVKYKNGYEIMNIIHIYATN